MLPANVVAAINEHKRIAEGALVQLSRLNMLSMNKPWNVDVVARVNQRAIDTAAANAAAQQGANWDWALANYAANSRVGNCGERGRVFGAFAFNHNLAPADHIYIVNTQTNINNGWDHQFAVLTDAVLNINAVYPLAQLGPAGVILDGWTEDWSFPNVGKLDTIWYDCWRAPNPFTLWVREKTRSVGQIYVDSEM
jgi:hypothetical protein